MTQRLDIDSLRTLCAIEDRGGVTRASTHLALSQSAVSHKVKRLESNIECALLTRRPGGPMFTDEGKRLLTYARRILSLHDEALQSLSKAPLVGKIWLGMTEDTTSSDLSRILGRFTRLHPNISVRTHVRQSMALDQELTRGEIDLAVMQVFNRDVSTADIILNTDRLYWVKAHDLLMDMNQPLPFLAYDDKCFYKHWANSGDLALSLETVLECASSAGIVSAVQAGLGIALLPGRYVTNEMQVIEADLPPPPDITFIIRKGRKPHSKPVAALSQTIEAEAGQLVQPKRFQFTTDKKASEFAHS
jgi:DNA-binding transcriptional LysR family regulator